MPDTPDLIAADLARWKVMSDDDRAYLVELTTTLRHQLRWESAHGFACDERMRILVSAQAAMLLLGFADNPLAGVGSVILHPTTQVVRGERHAGSSTVMTNAPMAVSGHTSDDGPVVLAWDAVLAGARHPERGHNVVHHEFAHRLDMLDSLTDGTPLLGDAERTRWVEVCEPAYRAAQGGHDPLLGTYAGVNPGEFFAVVTELFFGRPGELAAVHPDLFDVVSDYFNQDPRVWEQP